MAIINRGYSFTKDGKIKKSEPKRNVSLQMKIARSKKKPRVVSPAKASTASIARGYKP